VVVVVGGVGVGGVRLQFKPILEDFRTPLPIIIAQSLTEIINTDVITIINHYLNLMHL